MARKQQQQPTSRTSSEPFVPVDARNETPLDEIVRNWLPKPIHASKSNVHIENPTYLDKLLDLEDRRDALMHEIAEERQRVFGFEPTGSWRDSAYYHIAIPQALFDQLGHYDKRDVRRVCLAWLLFNECERDLSENTRNDLYKLLEKQPRLNWYAGTYRFPDEYTNTPDVFHKDVDDNG